MTETNKIKLVIEAEDRASGVLRGIAQFAMGGLLADGIRTIGTALKDLATDTIAVGSAFESQMAILGTAVSDTSVTMEQLHDATLTIGADTSLIGVSAAEAGEALTGLYKAGLDTTDIFGDLQGYLAGATELSGAMRAAVDLQAASELDLAQASDLVAISMATFGLGAEDATRIADNFVQTADASVAEVSSLAEAMTNIGPTAAAFGMSLEDTNVALGLLSTRGIAGAEAGTALKSMLVNLMRPTDDVMDAMKALGLSLYDEQGQLKELSTLVADFSEALGENATITVATGGASNELRKAAEKARDALPGLTTKLSEQEAQLAILNKELASTTKKYGENSVQADKKRLAVTKLSNDIAETTGKIASHNQTLSAYDGAVASAGTTTQVLTEEMKNQYIQTLAGTYGMKTLQVLINEGAEGWQEMEAAVAGASSAQEIAAARTDTFAGQMEALDGTIETLKIGLSEAFLPALTDIVVVLADMINNYAPSIIAAFDELMASGAEWGATLTEAWSWIQQNAEPILAGLAAMLLTVVVPAAVTSAAALAPVVLPILAIGAAVGGLVAAWQNDWGGIRTTLTDVWDNTLKPIFGVLSQWLEVNVPNALAVLQEQWNAIWPTVQAVVQTAWVVIQDVIGAAIDVIWPAVQQFVATIIENLQQFEPVLDALKVLWESLEPVIGVVLAAIGAIVLAAVGLIAGLFQGLAEAIGPIIEGIAGVLTGFVTLLSGAVDVIAGLVQLIVGVFTGNTEAVEAAWQKMKDGVGKIVDGLVQGVWSAFSGLVEGVIAFVTGLVEGVISFFTTLYERLVGHSIIPDLVNGILAWVRTLLTGWTELWDQVKAFVEKIWNGIKGFLEGVWNGIKGTAEAAWTLIQAFVEDPMRVVDTTVRTLWDELKGHLEGIWDGIKGAAERIWENIKELLGGAFDGMRQRWSDAFSGVADAIKGPLNAVLRVVEDVINAAIDGLNGLIDAANMIPGVELGHVDHVSLPRLHEGGFINSGEMLAVVRGNEAVLPLDSPRTVDVLADALARAVERAGGAARGLVVYGDVTLRAESDEGRQILRELMALA